MIILSPKDSQKIKVLIAMSGNDLKSFAKKAEISYSYFVSILSGRYNPSARTANKIAYALGVDIKDLFDIESLKKEESKNRQVIQIAEH